jgi:hypothetical protein
MWIGIVRKVRPLKLGSQPFKGQVFARMDCERLQA